MERIAETVDLFYNLPFVGGTEKFILKTRSHNRLSVRVRFSTHSLARPSVRPSFRGNGKDR